MSDKIEQVFSTPSEGLGRASAFASKAARDLRNQKPIQEAEEYWHVLGPGLTTGAADDDPSGIATYSQAGAQFGNQMLWLALFTFPLMAIIQEMCARIGITTGRGLAGNIRIHFPKWVLYGCTSLLVIANTFNIGADIGAMASAIDLVLPIPIWLGAIAIAVVTLLLQVYTTYDRYAKYLKWMAMVLLTYVATGLIVGLNWGDVARHTFLPSFQLNEETIILICAILGTTISPYLFFWQTSQEVEERINRGQTSIALRQADVTDKEVSDMRKDVWSGMLLSNIVMFFIIAATAATLHANGITTVTSAADAAEALLPLAGEYAFLLFTIGILGTGLLAIPVLAGSSSYALSETFGWKSGLSKSLDQAKAFYGVIIVSMMIGLGLNFVGIDPIQALIWSAVANGLVAPPILILIVLLSSNKKVMKGRVNHPIITLAGWIICIIMILAGAATIVSLLL